MDMIKIQRANVILEVSSEDKERFMEQGYSVIDEDGNIIEAAMPKDVLSLQKLVVDLKAELAKKDELIKSLTAPKKSKKTVEE